MRGHTSEAASAARAWTREATAVVGHQRVVQKFCEEAGRKSHFAVMTLLSAGIGVLDPLILHRPA